MNNPDVPEQPKSDPGVGSSALLEVLAEAFGQVSKEVRDLEDKCVHREDAQRARLRCLDIQHALSIAAKSTSNAKLSDLRDENKT